MKIPILWTLAWRNLAEHRRRTLSVGTIMALGLFLLIVGNAFLDSATQGVRASYIDKYTGDLFLAAPTRAPVTAFGGNPGNTSVKIVPLADFPAVQKILEGSPLVSQWNGHAVNITQFLVGETAKGAAQLIGIDPIRYQKSFPKTIVFQEGGYWNDGEHGVILNSGTRKTIEEKTGKALKLGDKLAVTLLGPGGKIREVTLTGVAEQGNAQGPLSFVGWTDIDTLRLLKGYTAEFEGAPQETLAPAPWNEDDLFSDPPTTAPASTGIDLASITAQGLGKRAAEVPDPNAWEFVTIKLHPGASPEAAQKALAEEFANAGLKVQVQDWITGAGAQAQTVLALKAAFNVIIFILALVAVFIVMNALMISVSERTTEIGTMRALGGRRKLIRNMILWEVVFLSLAAGAIGVVLSWVLLGFLNLTGVPLESFFLQMLFSSDNIKPVFSVSSTLLSWGELILVGVLSGWYPARTALQLSPLKAIQSD